MLVDRCERLEFLQIAFLNRESSTLLFQSANWTRLKYLGIEKSFLESQTTQTAVDSLLERHPLLKECRFDRDFAFRHDTHQREFALSLNNRGYCTTPNVRETVEILWVCGLWKHIKFCQLPQLRVLVVQTIPIFSRTEAIWQEVPQLERLHMTWPLNWLTLEDIGSAKNAVS